CYLICFNIISFGNSYKIWIHQFSRCIALFKEQLLPLAYHSKESVIQDHNLHCRFGLKNGPQFLNSHLISPISNYCHDLPFRASHFCTQGGRKGKSHSAQTTGSNVTS